MPKKRRSPRSTKRPTATTSFDAAMLAMQTANADYEKSLQAQNFNEALTICDTMLEECTRLKRLDLTHEQQQEIKAQFILALMGKIIAATEIETEHHNIPTYIWQLWPHVQNTEFASKISQRLGTVLSKNLSPNPIVGSALQSLFSDNPLATRDQLAEFAVMLQRVTGDEEGYGISKHFWALINLGREIFTAEKRSALFAIDILYWLFIYELENSRTNPCWRFCLRKEQQCMEQLLHSAEQFLFDGQASVLHPTLAQTKRTLRQNRRLLDRSEQCTLQSILEVSSLEPLPGFATVQEKLSERLSDPILAADLTEAKQQTIFELAMLFEFALQNGIDDEENSILTDLLPPFIHLIIDLLANTLPEPSIPDDQQALPSAALVWFDLLEAVLLPALQRNLSLLPTQLESLDIETFVSCTQNAHQLLTRLQQLFAERNIPLPEQWQNIQSQVDIYVYISQIVDIEAIYNEEEAVRNPTLDQIPDPILRDNLRRKLTALNTIFTQLIYLERYLREDKIDEFRSFYTSQINPGSIPAVTIPRLIHIFYTLLQKIIRPLNEQQIKHAEWCIDAITRLHAEFIVINPHPTPALQARFSMWLDECANITLRIERKKRALAEQREGDVQEIVAEILTRSWQRIKRREKIRRRAEHRAERTALAICNDLLTEVVESETSAVSLETLQKEARDQELRSLVSELVGSAIDAASETAMPPTRLDPEARPFVPRLFTPPREELPTAATLAALLQAELAAEYTTEHAVIPLTDPETAHQQNFYAFTTAAPITNILAILNEHRELVQFLPLFTFNQYAIITTNTALPPAANQLIRKLQQLGTTYIFGGVARCSVLGEAIDRTSDIDILLHIPGCEDDEQILDALSEYLPTLEGITISGRITRTHGSKKNVIKLNIQEDDGSTIAIDIVPTTFGLNQTSGIYSFTTNLDFGMNTAMLTANGEFAIMHAACYEQIRNRSIFPIKDFAAFPELMLRLLALQARISGSSIDTHTAYLLHEHGGHLSHMRNTKPQLFHHHLSRAFLQGHGQKALQFLIACDAATGWIEHILPHLNRLNPILRAQAIELLDKSLEYLDTNFTTLNKTECNSIFYTAICYSLVLQLTLEGKTDPIATAINSLAATYKILDLPIASYTPEDGYETLKNHVTRNTVSLTTILLEANGKRRLTDLRTTDPETINTSLPPDAIVTHLTPDRERASLRAAPL